MLTLGLLLGHAAPARALTEEEVNKTTERLQTYLYSLQQPDGSWEPTKDAQVGGLTALVTLALLVSGDSPQNPKIAKAIDYMAHIEAGTPLLPGASDQGSLAPKQVTLAKMRGEGTYALGVRCHVWGQLPPEYLSLLEQDGQHLLQFNLNKGDGSFHYGRANGSWDNSTTQYGVMGVWEAAKRGMKVPNEFWDDVAKHYMSCQNPDGGWQYSGTGGNSTYAMTTSGLTGMFIVRQERFGSKTPNIPESVSKSIQRGLDWLDKNYLANPNWYFMYGVERVGLASGRKYFNNQDWYLSGAQLIVSGNVSGPADASFALLFLSRGKQPVWVSKLQLPNQPWEINPHDMQYLSRLISNFRESEQLWQVVPFSSPPEEWLNTPVLYVASDKALDLDTEQKAKIKRYLDLGGMLLATPNRASPEFRNSVLALAKDLYPDLPVKPLPRTDPLFNALYRFDRIPEQVMGVSNGARNLILITGKDWSTEFQGIGFFGNEKTLTQDASVLRMAVNLWTHATDKGTRNLRLVNAAAYSPLTRASGTAVTIGRAFVGKGRVVEPSAWDAGGNAVYRQTGLNVTSLDVDLASIGDSPLPLIQLTGVDPAPLSDAETQAIKTYVGKGGTLLVETVGGIGEFSRQVEEALTKAFDKRPEPMYMMHDPIVTGAGLQGGTDISRVAYRRTLVLTGFGTTPRLSAIYDGKRPTVIFSHEDLTLGLMNFRQTGVRGYSPDAAQRVMGNILLSVYRNARY